MVDISERPAEADDRSVPGSWKGDLIIGKGCKSQIANLVERTNRFTMLVRIPYDRCAECVAALLARKMETLPEFLRHSLIWDQGKEMACHTDFTVRTGALPSQTFSPDDQRMTLSLVGRWASGGRPVVVGRDVVSGGCG